MCDPLRRTDVIPAALMGDYQKLLSSAPSRRLNPAKVRRADPGMCVAHAVWGCGDGWLKCVF